MNTQRIFTGLAALLFSSLSLAKAGGFALGVSAGTLGLGVDAVYGVTDRLNLRANYRAYDYSTDIEGDGDGDELSYKGDLALDNLGLGIDFHPFAGAFRLSLGIQNSDNKLAGQAACQRAGGCDFGDQNNFLQNGESAKVDVDLSGTHTYATLGWGNAVSEGSALGVFFDLGVMLQGTPAVNVTASCNTALRQTFCDAEAQNEEEEIQKEAEDFEIFPIVNLGLRWRFN